MTNLATGFIQEFHLPGQHDQSAHGRGQGGSVVPTGEVRSAKATLNPQDLAKLESDLNSTFGKDTTQRIREEGHNVEDYNFRDKNGNLTGKPMPGSDSWRAAHGIDKDVYDSRPVKRWEGSKDPVFDEFYGDDQQQKTFAKKLASQSDGFIMQREPLPGAEEAGFGPIPAQARPDNRVVIDQRGKARKERELNAALTRQDNLKNATGQDIIKEREDRVNRLKKDLRAAKSLDKEDMVEPARKKLSKAETDLKKAEQSGDETRISTAKKNRKIAENELKDATKKGNLAEGGDRKRAVEIIQQELNGAEKSLARAKADPDKALKNARDAADSQVDKKRAALDKSAVKYAFPPGEGSASRMEAHRDATNIKNLTEGNGRVYFVMEGQIKADAVLSQVKREDPTAAVVSVPSVTAWNKDEVSWATQKYFKGRDVVLIPDADGVTNRDVVKQAKTLQGRMLNDGAGNVLVASPPLVKNKRGRLEVEDIWYPTGVKDGRKGVDDHIGLGRGTLGDLTFNDAPRVKFDLSKETGSRRLRPNSVKNSNTVLESISDLSGEQGATRISKKSISKYTGLPESSVNDTLRTLEKKGYIKRYDIFNPEQLSRGRRQSDLEFDEIKRITKKAGVKLPDLNNRYVFNDDIHETAPIYEILDSKFISKPGGTKNLASVFKGLQTSDRIVRTPEGAERYGVSIGSKIPGAVTASGFIELHLVGQHDQSSHGAGGGGGGKGASVLEGAKKFESRKEADAYGQKHWGSYVRGLPKDQKKAIDDYVFVGDISQKIRSKNIDSSTKTQMEAFDKVFENAPRVPEDIVVHRGMKFSPPPGNPVAKGIMDNSLVGKTLRDPAYMSSSLEQRIATKYASIKGGAEKTEVGKDDWKVRMELKVPKGSKAAFVSAGVWHGRSGPVGRAYSLNELTFPRNTGIKISGISEPDRDGFRTITGEIVQ